MIILKYQDSVSVCMHVKVYTVFLFRMTADCTVSHFCGMRFPGDMDSHSRSKCTTKHDFDLPPESLIYQTIYKRIYS